MTPQILEQSLKRFMKNGDRDGRLAVGIHSDSAWVGSSVVELEGQTVQVASCRSLLEIRLALVERPRPLAIITPLVDDESFPDDILARLRGQKLNEVNLWDLVAERFGATATEWRLRKNAPLAQKALSWMDGRQPPFLSASTLTETGFYSFVLQQLMPEPDRKADRLDIGDLLQPEFRNRLKLLPAELASALSDWIVRSLGNLAHLLLNEISDVQPLALAVAMIPLRDAPSARDRVEWGLARGRLEQFFGGVTAGDKEFKELASAAEAIMPLHKEPEQGGIVRVADDILQRIGAARFAPQSKWSRLGAKLLLDEFASRLDNNVLLKGIENSYLRTERGVISALQMASRLQRWLGRREASFTGFEDAVRVWVEDGSWVDWARYSLRNFVTNSSALNRAVAKLQGDVLEKRDRFNLQFAKLLSRDAGSMAGVEQVLDRYVVPLLDRRVLLLVMDGMSWPVMRELADEIAQRRWVEYRRGDDLGAALSTLPSATQFSRCSLLSGALAVGGQEVEKRNLKARFPDSEVFHKRDLRDFQRSDAQTAIGDDRRKLVTVVVNAIDDQLAASEQTTESWSLDRLSLLQAVLAEADNAGRVVVLTSDHGHVVEMGTTRIAQADAADRWRTGSPESEYEVALSGSRVLSGGKIVALASERVRYSANSHHGYHGGATPQECIVPVVVLSTTLMPVPWEPVPSQQPSWWQSGVETAAPAPAVRGVAAKSQSHLFEASRHWITDLLESQLFKAQLELTGNRVKAEQVEKLLRVLDSAPGRRMLKQAFASQMQINALRVGSLIAMMQRVLNIDGYLVLTLDESTGYVALNFDLLSRQFELSEP